MLICNSEKFHNEIRKYFKQMDEYSIFNYNFIDGKSLDREIDNDPENSYYFLHHPIKNIKIFDNDITIITDKVENFMDIKNIIKIFNYNEYVYIITDLYQENVFKLYNIYYTTETSVIEKIPKLLMNISL